MGMILSLVIIGILALAIIGLGWQAFFSGVAKGFQQIFDGSAIVNVASEAKEYLGSLAEGARRMAGGTF